MGGKYMNNLKKLAKAERTMTPRILDTVQKRIVIVMNHQFHLELKSDFNRENYIIIQ
jgi:hypothetical protein